MAKDNFILMIDASLVFNVFVMFLIQGIISSFFDPYKGKDSVSVLKVML